MIRTLAPYLVVAALAFVVGGLTCRPSPPSPEIQALRDSLAASREASQALSTLRDALLEREIALSDSLGQAARVRAAEALLARQGASQARARGDSLALALAQVEQIRDSVPILVAQVQALQDERAGIEIERDRYRESAEDALHALSRLSPALDTARQEIASLRGRNEALERLVEGLGGGKPCRILGVRCPVVGIGPGATANGSGVRVGLTVGALVPLGGEG